MKNNFKQCKTKFLLFFLLALFAGGLSPAWAGTGDTNFDDVELQDPTLSYGSIYYSDKLSNGWIVQGGSIYNGGYTGNYFLTASHKRGDSGLAIDASQSGSQAAYLITPAMSGDVTFWFKSTTSSSSSAWQINVYEATDNGESFDIGSTDLIPNQIKHSGKGSQTWTQVTISNVEGKNLAFKFFRVAIDDFEGGLFIEAGCKKPKNLSASNLTFTTADLSWTEGEEGQDTWQVVYSTDANFDKDAASKTNVNTNSYQMTGLSDNTTYYVAVRSYCDSENQSAWVTTSFTTPLAPISSFPWTETFNSLTTNGTLPAGWDNSEGTTTSSDYKWCYNSSYSTGYEGKCIRFDSYNNSNGYTNFLKTPILDFTAGSPMQLVFWYKNPKGGDFSVYISDDGGATYTTELVTGLTGATDWTEKKIDIPAEFIGKSNVVIVFKGTSNYGSGDARIYLDEVTVKENAAYAWSVSGSDVESNTIAFGTVKNSTTTKTFTISNDGASALTGVTVTSSDNTVFTVSDTNFEIAAGATKDITITFVKEVVGEYSETITVSQANVDNIVLTATATYATPSVAQMAIKIGEDAIGETVAFGNVGKQTVKTFTVENAGEADLTITSIASNNTTDFTVSPATLTVHGGSSETFTVTFVWDGEAMDAEKTATITVTPSNDGLDPVEFTVTGTRIEQWSEDFSGNALPDGWENDNTSGWTFADGVAKGHYAYGSGYYLTTPSLKVEDPSDELTFDYAATANYVSVTIQKSKNGGAWESCSTATPIGTLNNGDAGTATITGLEAGNYKFRFKNDDYNLDNFQGFKRNMNDPKMGTYTDVDCTVAAAASVTKDFGFVTEDAVQTYYIKNDGTGTLTLDQDDVPAGFSAVLGKTTLAKDESTTLTITFGQISGGYRGGNIVVNGSDGSSFTVAVSGVMIDENKLNLNFATDNIPSNWTNSSFTKNANGYIESPYGGGTLQTSTLTAEAGETIVIVAKQGYSSASYTTAVNYRKVGDEEWSSLIAAQNIYNSASWKTLTATIEEAGNYQLQFVGKYVHIQRIYGLAEAQEPVMAVYDDEALAGASYDFGNVSDEADATWTLTVKNEGKATLTGLAAALAGDNADHYSVQVSATNVAVDASTTIIVKQLKDNVGSHSATLTISATGLDSKVITLSGFTYDHNKLFVDFENGVFPTGWTINSWTVATTSGNKHARAGFTASSLITTPLAVDAKETLVFKAKRQYSNSAPTFQIRYTCDGGVNWTDYIDYSSEVTSGDFTNIELSGIPEGTAIVEIYSRYVDIDDIYGFAPTTAPVLALTESAVAVANGDMKDFGNLTEDGVATYTLTNNGNGDLVSVVSTTGVATAVISGEGEGITLAKVNDSETYNKVTLAPGKSATITLTIPVGAPYGNQKGEMTITSDGWVGDMYVNYTANTIDPTALYEDFAGNAKPAGWYQESSGWVFSQGTAHVYTGVEKEIITEQYEAEEASGKNVLSFDAKLQSNNADGELKVYTSSDRKTWTLRKTVALTNDIQAVALDALADGNYYVKFVSLNASIDNLAGLKKLSAPAHDLYVTATTFPATTLVPNAVAGVNATATVHSLRANETGVYAKLFFDEDVIATAEAKAISLDGSATFTLTGNVPETEKTYAAKIVVYYSDNSVAFETLTTNVEVAHTRTLAITEFTRTDGDGALDANASNQISPSFSVTVENTGSTSATPVVKIYQGETVLATATADAAVAPEGTKTIELTATNMSAGEGGVLEFTAKAFWTAEGEALATSASNVSINVNAAAPLFVLYQDATPVGNGDDVEFGLVKTGEIPTYSYTIRNEGIANMELVSIVAPTGFTATPAITDDNKNIAVNGTLAITVTMQAEQGKKSGNLVITYKVDAMTNNTFTLALSGRSIAADTWTEDFEGGSIPENWTNNNGWTIGEADGNQYATRTGWDVLSIMTPRLAATEGEELTFDVLSVGNTFSYAYSTDKAHWSDEVLVNAAGEQTFTAPADGNYYLRFTTRNGRLDNLVGFRLNPLNLILDEASNNSFAAANYDKITLNRTFIAGWNTVCLPFAFIQESDIEEFFGEGAKVYYLSSHNGTEFFFDRASGMEAGYPYLVYVPEAITEPKVMYNVDIPNTATEAHYRDHTSNGSTIYFRGTYSPITAGGWTKDNAKDKIYVLTPEAKIAKAGASATSKGFRGYFDTPATMEVKGIVFDDIETGIISIENGELTIENGAIYNLAGQRINRAQKGVNIVNGKKMLVK